jgi:Tol biopolymer transport system component
MRLGICAAVALLLGSVAAAARSATPPVPAPSFEIYSIRVDGTGLRNVTNSPLDEATPAVSPNGRQIAFVRGIAGNWDLWLMNADGSGQKQLTTSADVDEFDPAWSPDGTSIAFTTAVRDDCFPHPCRRLSVRVVHADGTEVREVFAGGRDGRWSPNGRKLVFETDIDPYEQAESISVARLGGDVRKVVTDGIVAHPVWSRDGRLAFGARGPDLFVSRGDGRARRLVAKDAEEAPEWSPSGRQIAFVTLGRLKIVTVRTRRVRSVVRRAEAFAWSRSGRRLAIFWEEWGRIAVIKPDGRAFHAVLKISGQLDDSWLGPWTWSRDGRRLVYAARIEPSPPPK